MSEIFFKLNSDNSDASVPAVVEVNEVDNASDDAVKRIQQRMLDRAKKLSLNAGDRNLAPAVEFQIKNDQAQIQALRNPWYSFIIKVAGFSNEDVSKFWKDIGNDRARSQPLANAPQLGTIAQIDAAATGAGEGDDKEIGQYLKDRQYFLQSVEVRGYIFLTPICYSHVGEAVSLLENMCRTKVNVDDLIQSVHSTYFARLVSLRIQMTRFLSGRYYSLSSNYERLRTQQGMLMQYFKQNLGRSSNSSMTAQVQRSYFQDLAEY